MEDNNTEKSGLDRRSFIRTTAAATAGFIILPSHVISGLGHRMPSDKLNIVGVGVGGHGGGVIRACSSENIESPSRPAGGRPRRRCRFPFRE